MKDKSLPRILRAKPANSITDAAYEQRLREITSDLEAVTAEMRLLVARQRIDPSEAIDASDVLARSAELSQATDRLHWERRASLIDQFKIDRYDRTCAKAGVDGWSSALSFRRLITHMYEHLASSSSGIDLGKLLTALFEDPMGKRQSSGPVLAKVGGRTVIDLRVHDVWNGLRFIIERNPALLAACQASDSLWASDSPDPNEEPELCRRSFHAYVIEEGLSDQYARYPQVEVDLGASDDLLVSDFKEWLVSKRALQRKSAREVPPRRLFKAEDFSDWTAKRLLAYIDLDLLAKFIGGRFSDKEIGDILFPDEVDVDVTERIRKVTRPGAEFLLRHSTIETLDIQAARVEEEFRNDPSH